VDYQNVPLLLQALREAFAAANRTDYIIAMATPPNVQDLQAGYNLPAMAQYLDFFSVLSYEINGLWNNPAVVEANTDLPYIENAVEYILKAGVPSNQIVLGLASFGISYILADPTCTTAGCPFSGEGPSGCGGSYGNIPRFNIDQYIDSGEYNSLRFNNESSSMELVVNETNWITFDDTDTWNIRTTYALDMCLRGYFWWTVDMLTTPAPLSPRAGPKPIPPTPSPTTYAYQQLVAAEAKSSAVVGAATTTMYQMIMMSLTLLLVVLSAASMS
jgi:chitinase